jgi:hypothetical protein
MELGFASAPALNLLKMPYLAAHLGEGEFRERRSALHLHKVWEAARGGLHLPCLTDFDLSLIERLGGGCFLLEFESHRAPATFKYFGRELAIAVKRDLTGYPITAVPEGSLLAQLVMHCEEAVRTGKPIALDGLYSAGATEHLLYRSILLPFTRQGEKAECVLGCLRFRSVQAQPSAGAQHGSDQVLAPGPLGSGQGNSQPVFSQLSRAIQKRPLARSTGGTAEYREHASNETDRARTARHADPNSTRDLARFCRPIRPIGSSYRQGDFARGA